MTQAARQSQAVNSIFLKSLLAISFAGVLALAPAPAFAQHGGGGGGGSHGGGGGGGSHGSMGGGGGHASSGSSGSGSHATSNATSNATSSSNNGSAHWWNPFHGNSSNGSTAGKTGATGSGSGAANAANANTTTHFAAGNNHWVEPPANARTSAPTHFYANANRVAATSVARRPTSSRVFASEGFSQNRFRPRPIIIFPFNPFLFGFGFGSPFGYGFGFGCDPLWGWNCPLYGFGYGGGFGYGASFGYGGGPAYFGGGSSYGYAGGSDMNFQSNDSDSSAAGQDMPSPDGNSGGDWLEVPDNNSQADVANAQPYVVIYLHDGSSYAVSDYWLKDGKLHYVTSYGGENSVDANQLDLQRTVNENATHGITFTLRPTPATDSSNGQQKLQPPSANDTQTPAPNPQ
jgi:hypothetical protein